MNEVILFMYPILALACCIAIVVRFRGTPVAVLGGIAFGAMTAVSLSYRILPALKLSFQNYYIVLNLVDIAAWGCLLAALITVRVNGQSGAAAGKLVATHAGGGRGPISIQQVLFSFSGRISRSEYLLKGVLIMLPFGILNNILLYVVKSEVSRMFAIFIGIISLWPVSALYVKRWHDRDRSAWWFLTILIPVVNLGFIIWIGVETYFLKGTDGTNRFGDDPLRGIEET